MIKTDIEKLYTILTNLVKNAVKFTNEGLIEFGYIKQEEFLEFFVKDTGTGISGNQKEDSFIPVMDKKIIRQEDIIRSLEKFVSNIAAKNREKG